MLLQFLYCHNSATQEPNEDIKFINSPSRTLQLSPPSMNSSGNMKQRLQTVERFVDYQVHRNEGLVEDVKLVRDDLASLENRLTKQLQESDAEMSALFKSFKQEVHHRFDLQTAENRRLQQHISNLKSENQNMQKQMVLRYIFYLF